VAKKKDRSEKKRSIADMSDYHTILKRRASLVTFDDRIAKQMKGFCRFFFPRKTVLRKAFLSHDNDGNGVLNKKDWCVSIVKANREADKELIAAFTHQIFSQDQSACPYQEFMDVVFRQDVASYKRLLNRGCRLDRKETWGNVSAVIGGDWS